ncbi:MAG: thioesterase family protein [Oxalobacter sp.]|nr:thioesterase family protein [Oxalobacter sp.]
MLKPGLQGEVSIIVSDAHTARHMGSGGRDVLATPMLVALVEAAAQEAVSSYLAEGQQTVGVHLALTHDAATPVGMQVTATAELVSVNGRTLVFDVKAHDEVERIASGTHSRTLAQAASLDRMLQKKHKK